MTDPISFACKAWLLDGPVHSLPGILSLEGTNLSYLVLEQGTFSESRFKSLLATNAVLEQAGKTTFPQELFSVSTDSISRFHIPWYYFGAGGKLDIDNRSFRFSFVRPQNTVEPSYYSEIFMEWRGGKGQEEVNILEGRSSGKRWKTLLSTP